MLRFHWQWGENEKRWRRICRRLSVYIIEADGRNILLHVDTRRMLLIPTALLMAESSSTKLERCGWASSRETSALNRYCQAHDVKNLFCHRMARAFVTNADKNPTLTIMALTWRASDYIL